MEKLLEKYFNYVKKIDSYIYALNVINYDTVTISPKKSIDEKSEYISVISMAYYDLITSPDYLETVDKLYEIKETLNSDHKREIEIVKKNIDKVRKIPSSLYEEYSMLTSKSYGVWLEAKEKNDYNLFAPLFKRIIELNKEFALLQNAPKDNLYNYFLDQYEEGLTTDVLDEFFEKLKNGIMILLDKIKKSEVVINNEISKVKVENKKQLELTKYLLSKIKFDFERGAIGETEHPFCSTISDNDVRITTHIYEDMFFSNIFATIHEGGHALYEQNLSKDLKTNVLKDGTSMAIHESISRFYENVIGRSREFLEIIAPKVFSYIKNNQYQIDDLYNSANIVSPSLIRIEADELTYSLHIIIRYEMEKYMINNDFDVYELPKMWNDLYKKYLGVDVSNDSVGILQDSHWPGGAFGYFPSYALGNVYGLQFLNTMSKDINIYEMIKNDKIEVINNWFKENVFIYGRKITPSELVLKVTNESLNPKYYLDYLNNKFSKIYKLED